MSFDLLLAQPTEASKQFPLRYFIQKAKISLYFGFHGLTKDAVHWDRLPFSIQRNKYPVKPRMMRFEPGANSWKANT